MARRKAVDTDGMQWAEKPEVLSYAEQVEECFLELYHRYDVANAPEKRKAYIINSFWKDIYNQIFKPEKKQNNNLKSKVKPYDVEEIESILDKYFSLCDKYGGTILIDSFCDLIGYSRNAVYMWHNANKSNGYIFSLDPALVNDETKGLCIVYDGRDIKFINDNSNIFQYDNDEESQILSRIRYDVVKKIRENEQTRSKLHLSNSDIGYIFRSNNEDELGLKYDAKRTVEHEQIRQALSINDLPKLSDNSAVNPLPLPDLHANNLDTI